MLGAGFEQRKAPLLDLTSPTAGATPKGGAIPWVQLPLEISFLTTKAPPVPEALRLKARECIATYVQKANEQLGARMPMPTCSFDLRGKTAGKAWTARKGAGAAGQAVLHVQLNSVLFQENVQGFLQDTIPHEVAHLVTRRLYGRAVASHGPEWQHVMRTLGVSPERTHSYDVSNSAVASRLYRFSCACRTFELTPRKLRSALQGLRACRQCKTPLTYAGEARIDSQWQPLAIGALLQVENLGRGMPPPSAGRPTSLARPVRSVRRPVRPLPPPLSPRESPTALPKARVFSGSKTPPSAPLLRYVEDLARRLRLEVPAQAREDREKASSFVDFAKGMLAQNTGPRPAPVAGSGQLPPPATPKSARASTAPTEKQLAYANAIAARKGLALSAGVLADKGALSRWISAHCSAG